MDVFNIGVELWIGYWLFSVADYRRFHRKWVRWLEYVMFFGLLGINILGNRMMGVRFSNFLNITTVILYFICALVFTNRSWAACLAWGSIYYMSVAVLELPGIALTGWIVGIPYVYCVTENYIYDYIYLVIMSVFLLVIVRIWGNAFRKRLERLFYGRMNIFWLMFSVVEWWIVIYFLHLGFRETGSGVFGYMLISVFLIVLLMVVAAVLVAMRQAEKEVFLRNLQDAVMDVEYEKIKIENGRKSKEIHDLKHQLHVLESYLYDERYEDAEVYLHEISVSLEQETGK